MFSRKQRNGVLLLLALIVLLQVLSFFVGHRHDEIKTDEVLVEKFRHEVDSLKLAATEAQKPQVFPFNPNYITDYKGYTLGMSNEEIDRLLHFRAQGKWVNSAQQFQQVTQVSDSLLNTLSPYFKFPEWITDPKPRKDWADDSKFGSTAGNKTKTFAQKIDLNHATTEQLQRVNGIGVTLADRIIKYRSKFAGGFIADVQLWDIYGLTPEVIERITNDFTVKTPRQIEKFNLNSATRDQLVTIQHIDYEIAHRIIEQRTLREGYKSFDELLKVKDFPANKIEIIKLYLTLD